MIHIGIDYSMTSPAICIANGDSLSFHYLTSVKKFEGKFSGNVYGYVYPDWTEPEERFHKISEWAISVIEKTCDPQWGLNTPMSVVIEGYSMGSKGKVFHIAENTGILKYKLWQKNITFVTPAPTSIKKFATGKGNADKSMMYESFLAKNGLD